MDEETHNAIISLKLFGNTYISIFFNLTLILFY